jgi:endoglucanase
MDIVALLKHLSAAVGLSGYEGPVRALIEEELGQYADQAHMDEIGLMVTGVEEGFLRFAPVGGVNGRLLPAQLVTVHGTLGGKHDLPGVIASVPPHLLPASERNRIVPMEKLFVDVGLSPGDVEQRVRVGDLVSFRQDVLELKGGLLTGKAMDNRASVAAVTFCMALLSGMHHTWDVYAVATAQEEVGLRGALTGAFGVNPDIAIAIDLTFARQRGVPQDSTFSMGQGPTIGIGPNFHPALHEALVEVAKAQEIAYQIEPLPGRSGTDAWSIQISREGVPTSLLSIPGRYMHSPVEVVAIKDVERTGRLLAHFIAGLTPDFLETLTLHPAAEEQLGAPAPAAEDARESVAPLQGDADPNAEPVEEE